MKHLSRWLIVGALLAGLGAAAYLWWQRQQASVPAPAPAAAVPPMTAASSAAEPAPPAQPPIRHPIEAIQPPPREPAALPALGDSDRMVQEALTGLLGRKAVLSFLNVDDFVRRVVATVDNLARGHAAARLWPVVTTPARLLVVERSDGTYLADGNADRYTPFVRFATAVDPASAAALYVRLYPLFQQAYQELGYPGKYFNDRLVEVLDQLLETPELTEPVKLTLTQVQGPIPVTRPWVRYEFADPSLESRPAGQKILLRMGSTNARLLKAKLAAFRERISLGSAARMTRGYRVGA